MSLDPKGKQLARVRKHCLALPQVIEKLAWNTPCFYAGKKIFAMFSDDHHGDGRLALWLKAPPGMQQMLLEIAPQRVFKPAYVGPFGWIGLHLLENSDQELASHVLDAYRLAAGKKMLAQLPQG